MRTTEEQICCLRVVIDQLEDFRYCARNEIDDHIEPIVSILQEIIEELTQMQEARE